MATKQQEARRESAKIRQEATAGRTPQEQLARLDAAGLVAAKERAKLAKRMKAATTAVSKATKAVEKAEKAVKAAQ